LFADYNGAGHPAGDGEAGGNMEPRLSVVTLAVAELGRARAFYEGLGWKVAREDIAGEIVTFDMGGVGLGLFPVSALADDAGVLPEVPAFRGVTLAHNVHSREEVAAVLAEAERAGGRIVKPAADTPWGGVSGYFSDPDRHLWEVCWNPLSPLDAEGRFRW
jgi:catechol 2,3-dioxygenase-like lactoylglutathione lyase family enzyme